MPLQKTPADERREIRIGMLGGGFMGKCHSNAYRTMSYIFNKAPFRPRLFALCDSDRAKVASEAARYGFDEYCFDFHELAADERIEVFDNCGPDPVHVEPSIVALQHGKHVICEKPMAVNVDDARRMRDAARAAKGLACCTFNYRFVPAVRLARDFIDEGRLGRIYQMRANYLQMVGYDPATPPEKTWYANWPFSGGLQGIGSHAIDQCRFLMGDIKSVSGLVRTFNEGRAFPSVSRADALSDEGAAAIFDFENGAIGVLETSVVATGRRNFLSWEIHGSKGSVKWDLEHPNSLYACFAKSGDYREINYAEISVTESTHPFVANWWPHGHNLGWEHAHTIEKYHFLEAVARGGPLGPYNATFEDGYRVAAIIDAIRRSSASGERVTLKY